MGETSTSQMAKSVFIAYKISQMNTFDKAIWSRVISFVSTFISKVDPFQDPSYNTHEGH